ncbi:TIGR04282 family arsenosugar biosynthesis glycosyltransferase [Nocardioides sp. B-3]|uniref:TIGR04282 family arsenosugar biosynthesis glycosyltransferase n=1 Tax=Nocardioides sp. B-3 TaxID=2895565 RepID=UPI002152AF22|nr:DUF2064 domain-containing protein [Nocardioides sp. B-3]UUZ59311.1 DUF2064 domain-containing protein [Nocardioides sp. B-3]
MAKAPILGRAKTGLGRDIGMARAADPAAAALLDTIDACVEAVGADHCSLAPEGALASSARGDEITEALRGWHVLGQRGGELGERLAFAHADAPDLPRVQIGMDTPQVTPALLQAVLAGLGTHDAVPAPATDGGWWALALTRGADAGRLVAVPMSTATTGDDTVEALRAGGLSVATGPVLRDVDTVEDAALVAEQAPWTGFATAWRTVAQRSA